MSLQTSACGLNGVARARFLHLPETSKQKIGKMYEEWYSRQWTSGKKGQLKYGKQTR